MFEDNQANATIRKISRREFLRGMVAGAGTAVPLFLIPGPGWYTMPPTQEAPFTSWGQTALSFADLAAPYKDLGDWHTQYLPIVTRNK